MLSPHSEWHLEFIWPQGAAGSDCKLHFIANQLYTSANTSRNTNLYFVFEVMQIQIQRLKGLNANYT